MEEQSEPKKSFLSQLPPKFAFWAGVVTTATFFFAVGCVILVVLLVRGVDFSAKVSTKTTATNTNTAAAAAAATAATKVDLAGVEHMRGTGDITIVEFSDTECPFCKQFHETLKETIAAYDGQVKWGYKYFPLSIHPKATKEAQALECASDQNKFWEYTDAIYSITPSNNNLEDAQIYTIADTLGLDRTKFDACLTNATHKAEVTADSNEAVALGGRGTPFVLVVDKDGKILANIPGAVPFDDSTKSTDMKRIIDSVLN